MRRVPHEFVVLGVLGVLAGCGGNDDAGAKDAREVAVGARSQGVVAVGDRVHLPVGCKPRSIGRLAVTFSAALSSGDQTTLAEIWGGRFKWFSVGGPPSARAIGPLDESGRRRSFTAKSPEDGLSYVDPPRGFDFQLRQLIIGKASGGGVDVSYGGVWREKTGAEVRRHGLEGKGFINCGAGGRSIRVWSMGVQRGTRVPIHPCARAGGHGRRLVVC